MLYKTIILELLQEYDPQLYDQLRASRMLPPTLDRLSLELKARHEAWMEGLFKARPGSGSAQVASEALEIALQELRDRLPSASPPGGSEPPPLDGAMAFLRRHTPPA